MNAIHFGEVLGQSIPIAGSDDRSQRPAVAYGVEGPANSSKSSFEGRRGGSVPATSSGCVRAKVRAGPPASAGRSRGPASPAADQRVSPTQMPPASSSGAGRSTPGPRGVGQTRAKGARACAMPYVELAVYCDKPASRSRRTGSLALRRVEPAPRSPRRRRSVSERGRVVEAWNDW